MADPAQVMELPIARQLLRDEPVLHMSYTARDGGPRVIPIGYVWDGARFLMWTVPGSAKVGALQADERVAITIDVLGPPPRVLLARGRAALETVDGVWDAIWKITAEALTITPFRRLTAAEESAITDEAAKLLAFTGPEPDQREVRITQASAPA